MDQAPSQRQLDQQETLRQIAEEVQKAADNYVQEMIQLEEGGGDYDGNEEWRRIMGMVGRYRSAPY